MKFPIQFRCPSVSNVGDVTPLLLIFVIISWCSILASCDVELSWNKINDFLEQPSTRLHNNEDAQPIIADPNNEEVKVEQITPAKTNQEIEEIEEVVNRCCLRQRKLVNVGFDITGSSHYVDIGHCKHLCTSRHKHKGSKGRNGVSNSSFSNNALVGTSDHRSQERLSCSLNGQCIPSKLRSEKIHLLHGLIDAEIIDDCQCHNKPKICSRRSRKVAFFTDTPYETQLDVGSCQGPCNAGLGCRPLRNRTVTIEGPNGAVCGNIIEECTCTQECYRMQYKGVFVDRIWNATLNSTIEIVKELDIGRCVGECSASIQEQCVLWDTKDSKKCLMSLTNRKAQCVPSGFNTHLFSSKDGDINTVLTISECACK